MSRVFAVNMKIEPKKNKEVGELIGVFIFEE